MISPAECARRAEAEGATGWSMYLSALEGTAQVHYCNYYMCAFDSTDDTNFDDDDEYCEDSDLDADTLGQPRVKFRAHSESCPGYTECVSRQEGESKREKR